MLEIYRRVGLQNLGRLDWRSEGRTCEARTSVQPYIGHRNVVYLIFQTCYYEQVLVDASDVVEGRRMLDPRLLTGRITSKVPQPHCARSGSFQNDGWTEPVHGGNFLRALDRHAPLVCPASVFAFL